jgi:hypothetical protein
MEVGINFTLVSLIIHWGGAPYYYVWIIVLYDFIEFICVLYEFIYFVSVIFFNEFIYYSNPHFL